MKASLKSFLRRSLKGTFAWDLLQRAAAELWARSGKPVPPPAFVKRRTLADYGAAFGLSTLIETGTYEGDTLEALKKRFRTLYSIELSEGLAQEAETRFRSSPHIHILHGDSAQMLPTILSGITSPCLFWLDGHYSGDITAQGEVDTPILQELRAILDHPCRDHVLLIDDARHFTGTNDYPTVDEIRNLYASERPDFVFSVANDSIRIHPPRLVKTAF